MKNDSSGCLIRGQAKTADTKEAGAHVYLMEELGDARMRCDQLVRYMEQATKLVDNSTNKDHLFEVAGHLIQAIPETLFKLQKALDAVALAATRIDYEEIKQGLRPEKVEELERVLQDVRIRQVRHRSQPWTPKEAAGQLRVLADKAAETGWLDRGLVAELVLGLEVDTKTASVEGTESILRSLADTVEGTNDTSRLRLAALLRRIMADDILKPTEARNTMKQAEQDEKKESKFEEGKPADPTKNMSDEDKAKWKAQNDAHKDEFKAASEEDWKVEARQDPTFEVGDIVRPSKSYARALGPKPGFINGLVKGRSGSFYMVLWNTYDEPVAVAPAALELDPRYKNKRKHAADSKVRVSVLERMANSTAKQAKEMEHSLSLYKKDPGKYEPQLNNLAASAKEVMMVARMGLRELGIKLASEEEKESKFEEGKPADPTENMSDEDAKKWKIENLKNKDKFKEASSASWAEQLRMMQGNPPKVDQQGSQWLVKVFSVATGKYIVQGEFSDEGKAKTDLKQWQDDHKQVLTKLKDLSRMEPKTAADWKVAAAPQGSKLFKSMQKTVKDLIEARVEVRGLVGMLNSVYNDASGVYFTDNYQDKRVDEVRKMLDRLDFDIGQAFRAVEALEKDLSKKAVR